jgi:hypothetical protein
MCSSAHDFTPWRTTDGIDKDYELCRKTLFQSQGLLQHCAAIGDNYHKAPAHYLKGLYDAPRKKCDAN